MAKAQSTAASAAFPLNIWRFTMKKIINGKRYDTETAEKIGVWDNARSISDFDCC